MNSSKDLERMKALYQEGAISQQMLDGVQTQYEVVKANYDAAKSTVELTAPLSGVVTAVNVNVGDLASSGMVLVVIAKTGNMKALFNAGENDVAGFYTGQPADVYSELNPDIIKRKERLYRYQNQLMSSTVPSILKHYSIIRVINGSNRECSAG